MKATLIIPSAESLRAKIRARTAELRSLRRLLRLAEAAEAAQAATAVVDRHAASDDVDRQEAARA